MGARVRVYDPQAMPNARRAFPDLHYGESALEAATGAEVVVLLTEWDQFRAMDPEELGKVVASRVIVDGRHALEPADWQQAGWHYRALGRRAPDPCNT